jgi:hypothetical protein
MILAYTEAAVVGTARNGNESGKKKCSGCGSHCAVELFLRYTVV